jgi:glucosamine-6-phosphate deaminase
MHVHLHSSPFEANVAAADLLSEWLVAPGVRNVMVAAGNTPLDLYRSVGERALPLSHLNVFALDEYVGVPLDEPRNCANLLRRSVAAAWRLPQERFFAVSSLEPDALQSVREHEAHILKAGGLDVIVLGLGQNGHLGFNEPGSMADSPARLLDLEPISVEANRKWFDGKYAPSKGVTVGMPTILSSKRVMILAFGSHKAAAVKAMVEGPVSASCPASCLQSHPQAHLFVDQMAAATLDEEPNERG